ncbi:hypothetical protein BD410DRAFT_789299 [Rickenella mellea]|uniref:Uncharacterized protein n=1 Tax=Rickenella mellea TaxID=50990 RepID=A0A4Y7Q2L3_9AGAM|nr:hypothetical protein BD410DRAFT_789299 [Rickenella mellea]
MPLLVSTTFLCFRSRQSFSILPNVPNEIHCTSQRDFRRSYGLLGFGSISGSAALGSRCPKQVRQKPLPAAPTPYQNDPGPSHRSPFSKQLLRGFPISLLLLHPFSILIPLFAVAHTSSEVLLVYFNSKF